MRVTRALLFISAVAVDGSKLNYQRSLRIRFSDSSLAAGPRDEHIWSAAGANAMARNWGAASAIILLHRLQFGRISPILCFGNYTNPRLAHFISVERPRLTTIQFGTNRLKLKMKIVPFGRRSSATSNFQSNEIWISIVPKRE